jgi:hypothetical protein
MLALASFALSLPAQQQQQAIVPENSTAIAPDNSTAPPASGAPTTPTGNDYELVCEIILDTAASHSS